MIIGIIALFSVACLVGSILANKKAADACIKTIKIEKEYDELRHLLDYDYQDWGETL